MYSQNRSTNVSSKSSDSFWTNFFTKNGKDILLYCKSHSSPYPTITKKVIIGLIEQLCLYQMTDHSIKSCIGFAFPKLPQSQSGLNGCKGDGHLGDVCIQISSSTGGSSRCGASLEGSMLYTCMKTCIQEHPTEKQMS